VKLAPDAEVPAELEERAAQDPSGAKSGEGSATSPADSMHVDAPNRQDNARGHRRKKEI
jgi:hypothetical protein